MAVLAKLEVTDKSYFFAQVQSEARAGGPFEKSKAKQAELTANSDKSQVRIEKATATIAELKEQIKALQEQMAEMDAAQAEATALRNKEHEEFSKASTDYKESAEAVANA